MKKSFVYPSELVPGMKIAETILNDYGAIVMSEGTVLDDNLINKIKNVGVYRLQIFDEQDKKVEINNVFEQKYDENVKKVKGIISEISNGGDLNATQIDNVVDSVLEKSQERSDIVSCLNQIRSSDDYTYSHSVNVSLVSMLIGRWMKLDDEKIRLLVQAGLLHDIGKTKVPIEILNKPGKLTKEEFEEMKKHTVYGYRILEKVPNISKEVMAAVLMHHEKEDGSGYPTGLTGEKVNLLAKIVSVADVFDAMTSNRVYKEKESPFEVFRYMEEESVGKLNTVAVNVLLNNIASYYIGDRVRLSSGDIAEIIYINPRCVSKPIVKVGDKYIDMYIAKDVKIKEFV